MGFAIVIRLATPPFGMGAFWVAPVVRRTGLGRRLAREVLGRHPGGVGHRLPTRQPVRGPVLAAGRRRAAARLDRGVPRRAGQAGRPARHLDHGQHAPVIRLPDGLPRVRRARSRVGRLARPAPRPGARAARGVAARARRRADARVRGARRPGPPGRRHRGRPQGGVAALRRPSTSTWRSSTGTVGARCGCCAPTRTGTRMLLERLHTEDLTGSGTSRRARSSRASTRACTCPPRRSCGGSPRAWPAGPTSSRRCPATRRCRADWSSRPSPWAGTSSPTTRTDGRLVHTDLHYENVLAADREPWLVIDPKPLSGDPHYEPAPMLWNRWDEASPGRRTATPCAAASTPLVDAAGLDEDRARDWVVRPDAAANAAVGLRGRRPAPRRLTPTTGLYHALRRRSRRRCRTERASIGRQCSAWPSPRGLGQRRHARARPPWAGSSAGPRSTSARSTGPVRGRASSGSTATRSPTRRHHGGIDQAVYAFAREDLDRWARAAGRGDPRRAVRGEPHHRAASTSTRPSSASGGGSAPCCSRCVGAHPVQRLQDAGWAAAASTTGRGCGASPRRAARSLPARPRAGHAAGR